MSLNTEQIQHLAHLARLELTTQEQEKFTSQISSILEYFDKLNEVDTQGVEPLSQSIELENILRPDEIEECDTNIRDSILNNAPQTSGDYIKTNKIL